MKIAIISNTHNFNDDRLYYHFAKSLATQNNSIRIITCQSDFELNLSDNISTNNFIGTNYTLRLKISMFIDRLKSFQPHIILCSDPISVLISKKYSKKNNIKIIYDITEWYPSKKNLRNHQTIVKPFFFAVYSILYLFACASANGFIFGEHYKSLIPHSLFPKKKKINISYFPSQEYISRKKPDLYKNTLRLCYTGNLTIEKGILNFINVIKELTVQNSELKIHIKLIGKINSLDQKKFLSEEINFKDNVTFSYYNFQELTKYIELISDTDIFLDLRSLDFENTHCLPIKLFYFMALGRPVIYSNLKAIRKKVEIDEFGYLVNPKNHKEIARLIQDYLNNCELYYLHCNNAQTLFSEKYNWKNIEPEFLKYIKNLD